VKLQFSDSLLERLLILDIQEKDLEETFIRASGPGGQNVNKVATAVRLLHKPSGVAVRCAINRTQHENRIKARELLCDHLEAINEKKQNEKRARTHLMKARHRLPSKGQKARNIDSKRRVGVKKSLRRKVAE
jgi:peptide chain release factor